MRKTIYYIAVFILLSFGIGCVFFDPFVRGKDV